MAKPTFRAELHLLLAECLLNLDRPRDALAMLTVAQRARWNLPRLFVLRAEAFRRLGRLADAESWLKSALECPSTPWQHDTLPRHRTWLPLLALARLAWARRAQDEAESWLGRARLFDSDPGAAEEIAVVENVLQTDPSIAAGP